MTGSGMKPISFINTPALIGMMKPHIAKGIIRNGIL